MKIRILRTVGFCDLNGRSELKTRLYVPILLVSACRLQRLNM